MAPQPHACRPEESRGRLVPEPASAMRSDFQRDRDRIVHCGAFRRLQYKTQVFVFHEGDYYRTRLTHSIEVAQIARTLARALGLDEDLAEAVALAHDLGHTPFGHAGEEALDEVMAPYGGFDHNEQTFRILTALERRYASFDGLNLTWETLEGVVKHNGPVGKPRPYLADFCRRFDLELATHASAEAQVAALADDIAYNNHDLADGLRAGLFAIEDLAGLPLVGATFARVAQDFPGIDGSRQRHESIRRLINTMVEDVLGETHRRLAASRPKDAAALRRLGQPVVAFSAPLAAQEKEIRRFLFRRMYRHHRVNRMIGKARRVVQELFAAYISAPQSLPEEWRDRAEPAGEAERARLVADYIAGMTDRYALEEHAKLFDPYART
ncbi:MAG TPA: deoxyguanosinetriphosphate triphosphohydrolase [Kiloniellales bacterium]|nr:deoxyguanosinetriphosphate triphosphohydrolase [Kiloniellales bacterium]